MDEVIYSWGCEQNVCECNLNIYIVFGGEREEGVSFVVAHGCGLLFRWMDVASAYLLKISTNFNLKSF